MTEAEIQAHLRFVRRHIPEPTRCETPVIRFVWPQKLDLSLDNASPKYEPMSTGELHRRRFSLNGNSTFWAWTFDGKTPLFPEYDENDDSVK